MIQEFEILDQDFIQRAQQLIGDDFIQHYNLVDAVNNTMNGFIEFYDAFIIAEDNDSWIIGLWVDGNYLLYGKNFTENQLKVLLKRIDLTTYQNGFHFLGTKELIERIVSSTEIKFSTFKKRLLYVCEKVNYYNQNPLQTIGYSEIKDAEELSQMTCDFFEDEYKGKNNKDYDKILPEVNYQIEQKALWNLKVENELKSMCSVIKTGANVPIIGSFFTKRQARNLGFGQSLLFKVTDELLKSNNQCWLLADEENLESIKIFEKIGYKNVYKTLDVIINND